MNEYCDVATQTRYRCKWPNRTQYEMISRTQIATEVFRSFVYLSIEPVDDLKSPIEGDEKFPN